MSQRNYNIIALYGESGSGKDTVLQWMVSHYPEVIHKIIACTTRPPHEGEENGAHYNFLSIDEFTVQTLNGTMIEATSYRDQFYGTQLSALDPDKINIGIFSPEALHCICEDSKLRVFPIHVRAPDKTRLLRILTREADPDCYKICCRFLEDYKDFEAIDAEIEHMTWANYSPDQEGFSFFAEQALRYFTDKME